MPGSCGAGWSRDRPCRPRARGPVPLAPARGRGGGLFDRRSPHRRRDPDRTARRFALDPDGRPAGVRARRDHASRHARLDDDPVVRRLAAALFASRRRRRCACAVAGSVACRAPRGGPGRARAFVAPRARARGRIRDMAGNATPCTAVRGGAAVTARPARRAQRNLGGPESGGRASPEPASRGCDGVDDEPAAPCPTAPTGGSRRERRRWWCGRPRARVAPVRRRCARPPARLGQRPAAPPGRRP